ncbi:unnamed protein product [Urochloa humidicola]
MEHTVDPELQCCLIVHLERVTINCSLTQWLIKIMREQHCSGTHFLKPIGWSNLVLDRCLVCCLHRCYIISKC